MNYDSCHNCVNKSGAVILRCICHKFEQNFYFSNFKGYLCNRIRQIIKSISHFINAKHQTRTNSCISYVCDFIFEYVIGIPLIVQIVSHK